MSSVVGVGARRQLVEVIGVGVGDEVVLELVELVLVFIGFIFAFVDFGFDIEELVATLAAALSAVALEDQRCQQSGNTDAESQI